MEATSGRMSGIVSIVEYVWKSRKNNVKYFSPIYE